MKKRVFKKEIVQEAFLQKFLKDVLIMLHPFMPFVTEEIYSILPGTKGSVMAASYPYNKKEYGSYKNDFIEKDIQFVLI